MADSRRAEEVLTEAAALRPDGKVSARWEYMASIDPDYVAGFNELYRAVHRARVLPVKFREMIISVLLATRLYDRLPVHLHRAFDAGATEEELLEAMEIAEMITGAPTLLFGVDCLSKVAQERKAGNG